MALSFDTKGRVPATLSTTTTSDPITGSFACGANAKALVVMIFYAASTQRTGGTPTYNGLELTQVESLAGVTEASCEMWYLLDPPTGAPYDVVVQNDNTRTAWVHYISINAASGKTCAVDDTGINETTAAYPNVTVITTVSDAFTVACVATGDNSFAPSATRGTVIYTDDPAAYGGGSQYLSGSASGSLVMTWTDSTSDDYGAIGVAFKEVDGVPLLVVSNTTQSQTSDKVALTQHYALTVQSTTQMQNADNTVLAQHYVLSVNNATQGHTAENTVLTYHEPTTVLTVQSATQNQTTGGVALTQHQALITNSISQAQTSDKVALTQHYRLTVQSVEQEQEVEPTNLTLTQHNILVVNSASQTQTSENVIVDYHPVGATTLTVQNATQAQTAGGVSLTQHQILEVGNASQIQTAGEVALTQHYVLTLQDAYQVQLVDGVILFIPTTSWTLEVQDTTQAQYADNLYVGEPVTPPDVFVGDITHATVTVTRTSIDTTKSSPVTTQSSVQRVKPDIVVKRSY